MKYREFFRIEIGHQYFSPGEPVELAIVPDQSTNRFLKGQHLIVKDMINGIRVLIPVDGEGSALPVLQADDLFMFKIFPTSNTFHAFTAIPDLAEGGIMSFTNAGLSEDETQLVPPVNAETSPEANNSGILCGFPLVANVEIQVGSVLLDSNNVPTAPGYKVVFNSKALTWRYYVVSDPETTGLSINDINGEFIFNNVNVQEGTEDKIMSSLISNFPDANVSLFESETPIALRSQSIKNVQLLRHDADTVDADDADIIINHLPNPDVKDINFKIIKIHK